MADIIGLPSCVSPDTEFNTGVPLCDLIKGRIIGVIFADKGKTFTSSDCASSASLISAVKTATTAARGGRVYPVWALLNFEDNTGDPSTGSIGNLTTATIVTQDGVPQFKFGYNGGEIQHKVMTALTGGSYDVFFVDASYAMYGYKTSAGEIHGYSILQAYVDPSKFTVADAVNKYSFRVTLADIKQYRDQTTFVITNSGILAAVGLINVRVTELSHVTNVYKMKVIADGGTDLEPINGAAIAGLTWTAKKVSDGTAFIITSTADDVANKAITVTFDSTTFTALPSGAQIQLYGPTAAALSGAGVKPYEFVSVIITKP
ncbi:MAG TPA: hypothetical protein VLF89_03610 [Candidatus Saccharimonadales bacterium]|nr:hypothetical protein [Candidatus Saccharimonadales bacterium]